MTSSRSTSMPRSERLTQFRLHTPFFMRQDLDNLIRKPKLVKRKKAQLNDREQLELLKTKYAAITRLLE